MNGNQFTGKSDIDAINLYSKDANDAPANSILLCQPNFDLHFPTTSYGELITLGAGSRKTQLFFGDNNLGYHRIYIDNKWSDWKQFN